MRSIIVVPALALAFVASNVEAEEAVNPIYASWAELKPGTLVVIREVTEREGGGGRQVVVKRRTLKAVDAARVIVEEVIETEADREGGGAKPEPQLYTHRKPFVVPEGVDKARLGRPQKADDEGKEDVEVAGRTFHAEWFDTKGQTEAGPSNTRAWYSSDVPGLLLKSETRVPAAKKTTRMTVEEIKEP